MSLEGCSVTELVSICGGALTSPGTFVQHRIFSKGQGMLVSVMPNDNRVTVLWSTEPFVMKSEIIKTRARKLKTTWSIEEAEDKIVFSGLSWYDGSH